MTSFEMIKYHGQEYPADVPLRIEEIAAHFDITKIGGKLNHSLHTEYSYGKRKFNSELIANYPEICSAQKDGVPQLWKNEAWALQFADFIFELVGDGPDPSVIEVHPPFNDYTDISKKKLPQARGYTNRLYISVVPTRVMWKATQKQQGSSADMLWITDRFLLHRI